MAQNEKAIRVKADLHEKIHIVAASEGRSAANYLDWTMRPIVEAALGETLEAASATGAGTSASGGLSTQRSRPASPRTSRTDPALARQAKLNKAKGL